MWESYFGRKWVIESMHPFNRPLNLRGAPFSSWLRYCIEYDSLWIDWNVSRRAATTPLGPPYQIYIEH